ncbi:hypothetical protein AQ913_11920 [Burkholderia pseudomallei]|nr:hypothetical protein AQ913_11920 [Burkholderia pseudomallei]
MRASAVRSGERRPRVAHSRAGVPAGAASRLAHGRARRRSPPSPVVHRATPARPSPVFGNPVRRPAGHAKTSPEIRTGGAAGDVAVSAVGAGLAAIIGIGGWAGARLPCRASVGRGCAVRSAARGARRPSATAAERRAPSDGHHVFMHRSSLIARAGAARRKLGFMRSIRVPAWRIDGRNDE